MKSWVPYILTAAIIGAVEGAIVGLLFGSILWWTIAGSIVIVILAILYRLISIAGFGRLG